VNGDGGGRLPRLILALGIVGLLLTLYIGTQVIGVLVGILFPPAPPLPPNSVLVTHQSSEHGLDEWIYNVSLSTCDVITFYESIGGHCEIPPDACSSNTLPSQVTCTGESRFSIFAMRWDTTIRPGVETTQSNFNLSREVFWTGAVPPREFPLPESDDIGDN
jgi:hypothetical protein